MKLLPYAASTGVLLLLTSCASVSVVDREVNEPVTHQPPKVVYLEKFDISHAKVEIDKQGKELEEYKQEVVDGLYERLLVRLPEIAPTKPAPASLPDSGWLIRGQFVWVNHGTKMARVIVGLGVGATKMVTNVEVYNLAESKTKPFVTFSTTGGTNAEPGLIPSLAIPGPGGGGMASAVAGSVAGSAISGAITYPEDLNRTAREIRNYLLRLLYPEARVVPITPTGTKTGIPTNR